MRKWTDCRWKQENRWCTISQWQIDDHEGKSSNSSAGLQFISGTMGDQRCGRLAVMALCQWQDSGNFLDRYRFIMLITIPDVRTRMRVLLNDIQQKQNELRWMYFFLYGCRFQSAVSFGYECCRIRRSNDNVKLSSQSEEGRCAGLWLRPWIPESIWRYEVTSFTLQDKVAGDQSLWRAGTVASHWWWKKNIVELQ